MMRLIPNFRGFDFFPHDLRLPFMRYKGLCLALSFIAMALSLAVIWQRGFNYGVDFTGGTVVEVQSKSGPADIARLAREAQPARHRLGADPELRQRRRRADPHRAAEGRRGGAEGRHRQGHGGARRPVRAAALRVGWPRGVERAALDRLLRRGRGAARHRRLRVGALRVAVRGRRHRGPDARRAAGGGHLLVPAAGVRPLHRRGAAHHPRLLGQRHRGGVRPHPRELAQVQDARRSTSCWTCRSTRRCRAPS